MGKKKGLEEKLASAQLTHPPSTSAPPVGAIPFTDSDRALTPPTEEESRLRKLQLENEKLQLENEKLTFENQKVRNDVWRVRIEIGLRVLMALALFWVVIHYIYAVLDLTAKQTGGEKLSDPVLGVLLGTTSVNVIGLLLAVARYLFPPSGKPALTDS
jgi:hypothetical protein